MSIYFFMLAAIARAIGALPPDGKVHGLVALVRCAMQGTAAWLLVLASQSAVPIWILLPAIVFSSFVRSRIPGRWGAIVSDAGLVLIVASAAQPGHGALMLVGGAASFAAAGYVFDLLARHVPARALTGAATISVLAVVAALPWVARQYYVDIWRQSEPVPFMAVSLPHAGDRVTLPSGSVVWRLEPRGTPRETVVLFLHGAQSAGAMQSTAIAFRAALLSAGYRVVSLDRMGYGASPVPADILSVEGWDERPHLASALRYVRDELGAQRIVVIGHSMGCLSAMQSLKLAPSPQRAVLFGAAMVQELGKDEYWLQRFHQDRRLSPGAVPMATWKEIQRTFFSGRRIARELSPQHAPIVLVHFGLDHDDVVQTRVQYARELPGDFREVSWGGTNHYLNSTTLGKARMLGRIPKIRDLVLLDSRVLSRLSDQLPQWIEGPLSSQ